MPVRKNAAHDVPFALVDALDGSALTGASVSVYRCIDGAAQGSGGGSVVELGNGQYVYEGVAADFNGDYAVGLLFVASGGVPAHVLFQMTYFRKRTAYDIPFLLINDSNSLGLTGATPVGKRCLDGAAQENVSGSFIERGNGQYVFQAGVEDFNADDVVGFLITASGAVPVHLIIDLLESYMETSVLTDTPAAVIANYLTGAALMTVPSAAGDWPLYIESLPDGPGIENNAGAIYNTTPMKDGRYMGDGGVIQHYGVQITIRATTAEIGWDKCNILAEQLDSIHNEETILTGTTYEIHNVSRVGGINSLGNEPGTKRRKIFTMNFLTSITKL